MAGDERQAEIEAVALDAVLDDFLPRYVYRWEHIPNKHEHRDWWRREFERLIPIYLDRVRDARGDERPREPSYEAAMAEWDRNAAGWKRCREELAAARSPQGEDHEAALEALRREARERGVPRFDADALLAAYLSRVSPSPERGTEKLRAAAKRVLEADMRGVRDLDALNALEDAAGFSQQGQRRDHGEVNAERRP